MTDLRVRSPRTDEATALGAEAEALTVSLPPLLVEAERLSSVLALGLHGRRKAGMGETFWQFRRYAQGDSAGAIDWRQSARSQHFFVREREWEAAEAVWFWRDGSAGLHFASEGMPTTKWQRANLLAVALACLLVRAGERIALIGSGESPASGRIALTRMARRLTDRAADSRASPPEAPVGRNAQIVWLSDFLAPLPEIDSSLRRFARAGLSGHLVHLIDPAEEDFPYAGRTRFEWTPARRTELVGRAESVREEYRRRFRAHANAVGETARRIGWSYLAHRTDRRPEVALIALHACLGGMPAVPAAGL